MYQVNNSPAWQDRSPVENVVREVAESGGKNADQPEERKIQLPSKIIG